MLRDGKTLLDEKRYDEAQRAFARVLLQDRGRAAGYTGLGLSLLGAGREEEAFQALQKAIALEPKQARALYGLATLYLKISFPDEAIRRLQSAVAADPGDAECHFLLGVTLRDVGRSAAAEDSLKKAVSLKPSEGRYLANLAWVQAKANNTVDARKNFEAAALASPKDSVVLGLYGSSLVDDVEKSRGEADMKKAETLLQDAIQIDSNNYNARYNLGNLYLIQNKSKEAVPHLESAIERYPGMATAWYRLGTAYAKLGNTDRSVYCRKQFQQLSDYDLAKSTAEEQARTNLKDPALRLKLARLYARGGEDTRALNQYAMYLSLKPNDTIVVKEQESFILSLKKQGNLPKMDTFNAMILSAGKSKTP